VPDDWIFLRFEAIRLNDIDEGTVRGAGSTAAEPSRTLPSHPGVWSKAGVWALLLLGGGLWGVTFSLAKIATEGGAHPIGISLWQAIFGAVLLTAFDGARRRRLPLDGDHLRFYAACGVLGTAVPGTLYFYAAPHLPAGVLAVTVATIPMMTFVGALAARIDRMAAGRLLGIVLGIVAVAMIALPDSSLPEPGAAPWVLVALVAAACYAGENIVIALVRPGGSDAVTVLRGMLSAAALLLAPAVALTGSFVPIGWPPGAVEHSIFGMALINVISYGLFVYLVSRAGPLFASQLAYVVTLSGVIWGMLVFAETHSAWIWGAIVVMMAGLALVSPRREGA
jgi:drug/metabolite transporter (DMT)-like permease